MKRTTKRASLLAALLLAWQNLMAWLVWVLVVIAIIAILVIGGKIVELLLSAVQRWQRREPPPPPAMRATPEPSGWQPYRIQPEGSE